MKEKNDRASHTIKSVEKALILLEAFSELEGDINLTHLSQQLEPG
jgi:DNA-binding IclR family transcriptional regulator